MSAKFSQAALIRCDKPNCSEQLELRNVSGKKEAYRRTSEYGWLVQRKRGGVRTLCKHHHWEEIAPTLPPLERTKGEANRYELFTWQTGLFNNSDYPPKPADDCTDVKQWEAFLEALKQMYAESC